MANSETTSKRAAPTATRIMKGPKVSASVVQSQAGSNLTQQPAKVSVGSSRVIKDVSQEHRDALRRLVDR